MLALVESVDAAPRLIPPNAVSTKPKAEEGPAMLFLKHAFDDIVHGIDESIRTVPGGSAYRGFLLESGVWTREHWERAVELGAGDLSSCSYLIDDHGIWLRPRFAWDNQHDHFTWHPQAERENGIQGSRRSCHFPSMAGISRLAGLVHPGATFSSGWSLASRMRTATSPQPPC